MKQLLAHFDRISDAPDAIPRLRQFILDLAVRGKLVEQDPTDEPASTLLAEIRRERGLLAKVGANKVERALPSLLSDEAPFAVPAPWSWITLSGIGITRTGSTPPSDNPEYFGNHIPFVKPADLTGKTINYSGDGISELGVAHSRLIPGNSALMVCIGSSIGKVNVSDRNICCNQQINAITPVIPSLTGFVALALKATYFQRLVLSHAGMGTLPIISKAKWELLPIPAPPLTEQHRIVAKVDELMSMCDRLEAAQAERETRRDRLAAASLHRLNQPADPDATEVFRAHARFYLNHLPRLTTRPDQIRHLRQTILNLAVRGQLVPQDPNEEPASELLKRIQTHKGRLAQEGNIKKEDSPPVVPKEEEPFGIPAAWMWVRLGALTQLITKGSSPKWQGIQYVSEADGVLFVTSENVGNYRLRKMDEPKYVEKRFNEIEPRSILKRGDMLMNLVGASIGRTAVFDLDDNANINQAVALIRLVQTESDLLITYLLHYFNCPLAIQMMLASRVTTAQPNMSLTDAREFPVPLPPLAEQHRIVAKVDELMSLCAQLEAHLTTAQTEYRRLLEAVLHEALDAPAVP